MSQEKRFLKIGKIFTEQTNLYSFLKNNICDTKKPNRVYFEDLFKIVHVYESTSYLKENNYFLLLNKKYKGCRYNIFYFLTEDERRNFEKEILSLDNVIQTNSYWFWPFRLFQTAPEIYLHNRKEIYYNTFRRGVNNMLDMTYVSEN